MGKSVKQLLAQFDSEELGQWMAYSVIEPFGEEIADMRHGIAVAALANVNRDYKRRREPFEAEDFIPWHVSHRLRDLSPDGALADDPKAQAELIKRLFAGK